MLKNFSDSFRLCVSVFAEGGNVCAVAGGEGLFQDENPLEHLSYVIWRLKSGISDEVLEIIGKESDNFVFLVNRIADDDRRAVILNVFDRLTDRLDEIRDDTRLRGVHTNSNRIHLLEAVLYGLLRSFRVEQPLRMDFTLGDETFSVRDWGLMKSRIAEVSGI